MLDLYVYLQGDSRWKKVEIGKTRDGKPITLGSDGCLISSVAMGLKNYAINITPGALVDVLKEHGGLAPTGEMIYSGLVKAFPQLYFFGRCYTENFNDPGTSRFQMTAAKTLIRRLLKLGNPVYLQVDAIGHDNNPDHFVVAYDWKNDLWIQDPAYGTIGKFSDRYGEPMKGIYGFVAFIGPPIAFPEGGWPAEGQALWKITQAAKDINRENYIKEAINDLIKG